MSQALPAAERALFLREALRFADGSRKLIRRALVRGFRVRTKADASFVTDADLGAERLLRREIARRFPAHGIIGEEFPPRNPGAEFQWILDPIDGTLSFTRGIPLFGTLIALQRRGRGVVGVIDHPALDDRCWAAAGLGAFRNGRRLRVAASARPEEELVACGDRMHFHRSGRRAHFDRLLSVHPQVRSYADCFGHSLAARGAVGAMVDYGIKLWDFAPTPVIVEEAGGSFRLIESVETKAHGRLYNLVCGKPRVVEWLIKRLRA